MSDGCSDAGGRFLTADQYGALLQEREIAALRARIAEQDALLRQAEAALCVAISVREWVNQPCTLLNMQKAVAAIRAARGESDGEA